MSTLDKKEVRINLKISPTLRAEFHAAAHLRGASMSSLLHQYIVKVVREEKDRSIEQFDEALEFIMQSPEELVAADATHKATTKVRKKRPGGKSGRDSGA